MLILAWKDWERKASHFPPEVAFQLYSFHCGVLNILQLDNEIELSKLLRNKSKFWICDNPRLSVYYYQVTLGRFVQKTN